MGGGDDRCTIMIISAKYLLKYSPLSKGRSFRAVSPCCTISLTPGID